MIRTTIFAFLLIFSVLQADEYFASFTITNKNDIKVIVAAYAYNKPSQFKEAFASSVYEIEVMKTTGPNPSQGDVLLFKSRKKEYNKIFTINPKNDNPSIDDKLLWVQFIETPEVSVIFNKYYESAKRKLIQPDDIPINPSVIALNDSVKIYYNKENQLHFSGDEELLKYLTGVQNKYIILSLSVTDSIWQLTPEVSEGDTIQETINLNIPILQTLYYKHDEKIDNFTPTVKDHPKYKEYAILGTASTANLHEIITDSVKAYDMSRQEVISLEYIDKDGRQIDGTVYLNGCFEEKEIVNELGRKEKHYIPCDMAEKMTETNNQLVTIPPTYIRDNLTDVDSKRNYPVWIPNILKDRLNIENEQKVHPLLKYIPLGLGSIVIILLSV